MILAGSASDERADQGVQVSSHIRSDLQRIGRPQHLRGCREAADAAHTHQDNHGSCSVSFEFVERARHGDQDDAVGVPDAVGQCQTQCQQGERQFAFMASTQG